MTILASPHIYQPEPQKKERSDILQVPEILPRHLAIIMDGNGRWAQRRALPRLEGHRKGASAVRKIVRTCRKWGLEALTLYAFSSQNWGRPPEEVLGLMQFLANYLQEEREEILQQDIRLTAIGDTTKLPAFVQKLLNDLIKDSANNRSMTLCLALSYGGRESLVHAAKTLCQKVKNGEIQLSEISEEFFGKTLETHSLPTLDLIIRTSGEERLSNFLLWEAAYAEFFFTQTLWPDFDEKELWLALQDYSKRERRFGLLDSSQNTPAE